MRYGLRNSTRLESELSSGRVVDQLSLLLDLLLSAAPRESHLRESVANSNTVLNLHP